MHGGLDLPPPTRPPSTPAGDTAEQKACRTQGQHCPHFLDSPNPVHPTRLAATYSGPDPAASWTHCQPTGQAGPCLSLCGPQGVRIVFHFWMVGKRNNILWHKTITWNSHFGVCGSVSLEQATPAPPCTHVAAFVPQRQMEQLWPRGPQT